MSSTVRYAPRLAGVRVVMLSYAISATSSIVILQSLGLGKSYISGVVHLDGLKNVPSFTLAASRFFLAVSLSDPSRG